MVDLSTIRPMGSYGETRITYDPPVCAVLRASAQTIGDATEADIDFLAGATVEVDTHGMFDTTNPDLLTVKMDGVYFIMGNVQWASDNDGRRDLDIMVNGTAKAHARMPAMTGIGEIMQVVHIAQLRMGDTIALQVRHTAGGNLDVIANDYSPRLAVMMR
jgi:hypothetical protein